MTAILQLILWLALVHTGAGLSPTKPTHRGLPLTAPSLTYGDLPANIAKALTQCPDQFHGCSIAFIGGIKDANVVTCSCARNCRVNGDCCWNVPFVSQVAQTSRTSCIGVQTSQTTKIHINMVTGCLATWPADDVRFACEKPELFDGSFYFIPATTVTGVTYRNGFCALCNGDLASTTFWSVALHTEHGGINVVPPSFAQRYPSLYLRPCDLNVTVGACSVNVSDVVSQKCKTYYAPVRDASNPYSPVFKNVYCALCNTVNVSRLSCGPTVYAPKTAYQDVIPSHINGSLNLVTKTPACYARYDGRCYIRRSWNALSTHRSSGDKLDTPALGEPTKLQHSPYTCNSEFESDNSLRDGITIASAALSTCLLVLKLIVFCAFKEARNSSSTCTMCLAGTLLVAQVLFLINQCADLEECACFALAVFSHYCFLSTFLWTGVLSFDIWKSLTTVHMSSTSKNTLAWYSLFAWGVPLLVVSGAVAEGHTAPDSALSPDYGEFHCFIGSLWGLVVYFFVPMATLVLLCLVLYFKTVCYIRTTSSGAGHANDVPKSGCRDSSKRGQERTNLALFARLSLVMGAPWAITLAGSLVPNAIVGAVVDVMIGSQGIYLFFAFKDYRYLWDYFRKKFTKTALSTPSSSLTSPDANLEEFAS
ncbi:hypothetical protein HPB52_008676 [Rhipicephalus sanguineus]|uniref:G-protein coupled receptors family 2 profile 2 domain-containing protein n=1 Tax=Rhipicephalus sanguineus TaxID=34632 RepID=A0A9D4QE30_RHISA|nr:hypothetical protein HPB52_008676 [Rhipicephalus sanguineus]